VIASEDYRQLAQRYAQLAMASSAPSVAATLMALASYCLAQSHELGRPSAGQQHQCQIQLDTSVGFGD
jgi:hypothetical protein